MNCYDKLIVEIGLIEIVCVAGIVALLVSLA